VNAQVQLSGSIAQFGRTGLLTEIANHFVADFVVNAEAELARTAATAPALAETATAAAAPTAPSDAPARATQAGEPLNAGALLWSVIKGWFRSVFRGSENRSGAR
jgi:hypothetical protein